MKSGNELIHTFWGRATLRVTKKPSQTFLSFGKFQLNVRDMLDILTSKLLTDAGFPHHGFTTRLKGVSKGPYASLNMGYGIGDDDAAVCRNHELLRIRLDADMPMARLRQVHSGTVVPAAEVIGSSHHDGWRGPGSVEADGIVSESPGVLLAVQVADCVPVLLADPKTGSVAAVHAGWRGASKRVVQNAVRKLEHLGASPGRIVAALGPRICPKCYEVGEDVARHFPESVDPLRRAPGKFLLDLARAVEVSLLAAGLSSRNIDVLGATTCCDDRFYSYRKSGGTCGRGLGFISG